MLGMFRKDGGHAASWGPERKEEMMVDDIAGAVND